MPDDMIAAIQPHNARPAAVWSSGGAAYDAISRSIGDAIEHCVRRLDPQSGERILDVATGTGRAARAAAEAGAQVTAVDIAGTLVEAGRAMAATTGLPIDFQTGDAERLPFPDASFDGVVSTFGVMFASKPEVAAAELARVCKPGGRLALATWTTDGTLAKMFGVMRPFMPPPPDPAPASPFAWGDHARLRALLGGAFDLGFESGVSHHRAPDGDTIWRIFLTGYGPTKMLAESLDAGRRQALQDAFTQFHDGFGDALGVTVRREYVVTRGLRR